MNYIFKVEPILTLLLGNQSIDANQTLNLSFTVPVGTSIGSKRLRIRCTDIVGGNLDPCLT